MDTFSDQMEGFYAENSFNTIFTEIRKHCPDLKFGAIKSVLATVAPDFEAGLFESRPCNRRLRYIGMTRCPEIEPPTDHEYFKLGQNYASSIFNGATYTGSRVKMTVASLSRTFHSVLSRYAPD